jgi:DNA polymerase III delta prime subunit
MALKELWVEKYRPHTIDDYVWMDDNQKHQVEQWIADRYIPHLLLSGSAGVGKTTLAKILVEALDIEPMDFLHINASRDNGVEFIKNKITGFGQTSPFGDFKVVLLDEADYLSLNAQATLRGIMEEYSSVLRIILTCNYPNKIMPAIHSRTQGFHFKLLEEVQFQRRLLTILVDEGVDFDTKVFESFVKATYPDMRKAINSLQQHSTSGKLELAAEGGAERDYRLEMVALFRERKYRAARELAIRQIAGDEYEDMFRFLYRNLDFWGATDDQKDSALLIIRQGIINHSLVSDPEINLAATMIELERIAV